MKLSKDELKAKIDEKIEDENLKIELLEDIEDSVDVVDDTEKVSKEDYDSVVAERDEIREKYKARFLSKEEKEDVEEKEDEGLSEKEEIDVKEIFKEEDE